MGFCFYSKYSYAKLVLQDFKIRKLINKNYQGAQVGKVFIERPSGKSVVVNVYVRRPGVVIGKSGGDIDKLKKKLSKVTEIEDVYINVHEIKRPDLDAKIVAQGIATQLERRVFFRRAMKKAISSTLRQGAKGIRVNCSGRLGGAEIARTEWYREGRVPLHTLRANVDYSCAEAKTTYGIIGVKVWIYREKEVEKKKIKV